MWFVSLTTSLYKFLVMIFAAERKYSWKDSFSLWIMWASKTLAVVSSFTSTFLLTYSFLSVKIHIVIMRAVFIFSVDSFKTGTLYWLSFFSKIDLNSFEFLQISCNLFSLRKAEIIFHVAVYYTKLKPLTSKIQQTTESIGFV